MDEEKYINIKKEYIIIFAVMAVYFALCVAYFEFALYTYWLFSLVMGVYFYISTNSIVMGTAIWFGYSGLLELILLKEDMIGACFFMTLLFLISATVTKMSKKKE